MNKKAITLTAAEAILLAAKAEGGQDGLMGYLRNMSREHPDIFGKLLERALLLNQGRDNHVPRRKTTRRIHTAAKTAAKP